MSDIRPRTVAAVLALAAVLLATTLDYRMGADQGTLAYIASELLKGNWPYVGAWEQNFPGVMFLQAVTQLVLGRSPVMYRVFDMAVQLGICWAVFATVARLGSVAGGVLAVGLYCLTYQSYGPWNTGQREGFAMAFVLAGWMLYLTRDRRPPAWTAAWIGLGLGVAVTFKPTMLALSLLYLPLLWPPPPGLLRIVAPAAVALVLPTAAIVARYWLAGGLTDLYEATIAFQQVYTRQFRGDAGLLSSTVANLASLGRNALVMLVAVPAFLWWGPHRRERVMVYLGYFGSVLAVAVQGTFAGYHYLPGLALGSILVGCIYAQVVGFVPRLNRPITAWRLSPAVVLSLALLIPMIPGSVNLNSVRDVVTLHFLEDPRPDEYRNADIFDYYEDWQVAGYLRDHTSPDDKIQVWGFESLVYYLANRSAASRFHTTHPLVMRVPGYPLGEMQIRWRREFIESMNRERPLYVAVVRGDHWWWTPGNQTSEELLMDFPELNEVIRRDYALETEIGRFALYRRAVDETARADQGSSGPSPGIAALAPGAARGG